MTDFSSLLVPDRGQSARTIHLLDKDGFAAWLKKRPQEDRALVEAQRFDAKSPGSFVTFVTFVMFVMFLRDLRLLP